MWQEIKTNLEGFVAGRFLAGGSLSVPRIELPDGKDAGVAQYKDAPEITEYIDSKTVSVVPDQFNDTHLRFSLQWKKEIPVESKVHFQVTKFDPKDTKKASGLKNECVMTVKYVPKTKPSDENPTISDIHVEGEDLSATWNAGSKVSGCNGCDLGAKSFVRRPVDFGESSTPQGISGFIGSS